LLVTRNSEALWFLAAPFFHKLELPWHLLVYANSQVHTLPETQQPIRYP
jgi:hypothetical protein